MRTGLGVLVTAWLVLVGSIGAAESASGRQSGHAYARSQRRSMDQMMAFGFSGRPRMSGAQWVSHHTPHESVGIVEQPLAETWHEGHADSGPMCDSCCHAGCAGGCGDCLLRMLPFAGCQHHIELFGGVHGFTGPLNRGGSGSFGFHEGINLAVPLDAIPCLGFGAQVGARATQSNFSGVQFAELPSQVFQLGTSRNQIFVTGGLFRRVDWGLQGGVVFDYLHDDWFYDVNVVQLRGELSWVYPCAHEVGFRFQLGVDGDAFAESIADATGTLRTVSGRASATDLYAIFYRHRFEALPGAELRATAGVTDQSDGVLGLEWHLPVSSSLAVQNTFTYLLPNESAGRGGEREESWNVAFSLVWTPGAKHRDEGLRYYRPLFGVADNGSFLVNR